ncbi:MAG: hypothetical protein OES14_03100 [Nitrosopumilus sp.]|nr:hypothetical protein [Nitrosopumilus sp.]MDH3824759.1 hypothetical protein [Nitrosopumilus sp.]
MMDMIVNMVAQKVGIPPEMAKMAIPLVSKFLLQKSSPDQASGLLSALPTDVTGMFSDDEKKDFTTTQHDMTEDDLINQLDSKCGINDKGKSKQVVSEIMSSLQQNSSDKKGDLFGGVMGNLGKGDFNPFG